MIIFKYGTEESEHSEPKQFTKDFSRINRQTNLECASNLGSEIFSTWEFCLEEIYGNERE